MTNVPAATQSLRVLKLLAGHAGPLPAAQIARDLDLPRSTIYHLLAALRAEGFVVHLPDERRYGLGVAAFELGSAYVRQEPLRWVAAPSLARLVAATDANGHFAVLDGRDVLYVIEERAPGRASLVTDVGVRLPAHLTASGLAILAALPLTQVRALFPSRLALAQHDAPGPKSVTELLELLSTVRDAGYATEEGSVTDGFASVAAPVFDHRGHPIAAVAVTLPRAEFEPGALAVHARRAAAQISRGIQGSPRTNRGRE